MLIPIFIKKKDEDDCFDFTFRDFILIISFIFFTLGVCFCGIIFIPVKFHLTITTFPLINLILFINILNFLDKRKEKEEKNV